MEKKERVNVFAGEVKTLIPDEVKQAVLAALNALNAKAGRPNAYVVETWRSGSNWYRRWSDGFTEQGGELTVGSSYQLQTIQLHRSFSTTTYDVSITGTAGNKTNYGVNYATNKTTTNFTAIYIRDVGNGTWSERGY